jgi:hypothetical protein
MEGNKLIVNPKKIVMKKAIIKRRTTITALITFLILGFTQLAWSGEITPAANQASVDFKFIAKLNNGPVFQLNMNNPETGEFLIKVRDADGNLLFSESIKGINISRKYQLAVESEELYEALNVKFEITSLKTNKTLIFNATHTNRTVSDIIIARM